MSATALRYAIALKEQRARQRLASLRRVLDQAPFYRFHESELRFLIGLDDDRRAEWLATLDDDAAEHASVSINRFGTEKRRCTRNLWEFAYSAWPIVEPGIKFQDSWHIHIICHCLEHLYFNRLYLPGASVPIGTDGAATGDVDAFSNMLINIPPGCMKSYLCSVFFPCWVWIQNPAARFMFASTTAELSKRDSGRRREIISSDWFKHHWEDRVQLKKDQNQKMRFDSTAQGFMYATSVGGTAVGEHMDYLIIDDPHDPESAMTSDRAREDVLQWWRNTIALRGVGRGVRRICIMQRLHDEDLAGHLLKTERGWYHLKLPMRFNGESKPAEYDPRTELDELLYPALFPRQKVEDAEIRLGPAGTEGQHQQDPPVHFMGYEWPSDYFTDAIWFDAWPNPDEIVLKVMATDPSLGRSDTSDYSAIVQTALTKTGTIYVDADIDRRPPRQIAQDAFRLHIAFQSDSFVVETNGFQSLMEDFVYELGKQHGMLPPFHGVEHHENKDQRIRSECGYHLAKGEFRFKRGSPGAILLVEQLQAFPSSKRKKDGPDALAMCIHRLRELWVGLQGDTGPADEEYVMPA